MNAPSPDLPSPDSEREPAAPTRDGGAAAGAKTAGVQADTTSSGSAEAPSPPTPAVRTLGRFRIEGTLGHGGMGTVYRAFDPTLNRHVALKVPRFDAANDPDLRRRFLAEARAAAAVSHPNLVEVYEADTVAESDGVGRRCYIASALCDGPDLAEWLADRDEPVDPSLAAALLIPIAKAVHCCHLAGVIHRDLKPANILLDAPAASPAGPDALPFVPKVSDFGVARMLEESAAATRTSRAVGTPLYMAPEQAAERSDEIGPATDVWALGAVLYEALTGRPPFEAETMLGLLKRIAEEDPPPPRHVRTGLPSGLDAICMKCLRKEPADRYASAAALAEDLAAWRAGRAVTARRFGWFDRLGTWLRQPQRVRDAGAFGTMWHTAMAVGISGLALDTTFGWMSPLPQGQNLAGEAAVVVALHVALAVVSWRILYGSRWAFWTCFAAAVLSEGFVMNALLFGGSGGFTMYRDLPEAQYLLFMFTATMFTVQLIVFLLALRARPLRPT